MIQREMAAELDIYKAVPRDLTLSERAQQQLEELILNRSLRPGDRLPSQQELARLLGVSRTVVREAVQSLAAKGLLGSRKGSRIYVRTLGSELIKGPVNLLARSHVIDREALMETRECLEPKIAELAARRAQTADIEILEQTVRKMTARKLSPVQFAETDLAFHNQLAIATRNPLLRAMAISINDVVINFHHMATNLYGTAWICEKANFHHSRILEQIKAHNAEGARRAMEEHMVFARQVMEEIEASVGREAFQPAGASPAGTGPAPAEKGVQIRNSGG